MKLSLKGYVSGANKRRGSEVENFDTLTVNLEILYQKSITGEKFNNLIRLIMFFIRKLSPPQAIFLIYTNLYISEAYFFDKISSQGGPLPPLASQRGGIIFFQGGAMPP